MLEAADPARAAAVRARAAEYVAAIGSETPVDPDGLPAVLDEVACPALDPVTGCCDLYDARPITCRAFGPAARMGGEAVGACELCYAGATAEQIAECAVDIDPEGLESELIAAHGLSGTTLVAFALK